jgi:hypothetical protein
MGVLWTGDKFNLLSRAVRGVSGNKTVSQWMVTEAYERDGKLYYKAVQLGNYGRDLAEAITGTSEVDVSTGNEPGVFISGKYRTVAPSGTSDYTSASAADKAAYCFIGRAESGNEVEFSNGDAGHTVAI